MNDRRLLLLPTDGSPTAEAAARFAEDIARPEQDTVLVLGISEQAVFGHMEDEDVTAALHGYMAEVVAKEAAIIRAAGVAAESSYEAILEVAEERGVSAIVMGTHGRTGLARAIIGSVADRVVRHAKVPVVLVPLKSEG